MRREQPTAGEEIALWLVVCIVLVLLLMATGCASTVTPPPVVDRVPSFDGNVQNSGFFGYLPNGSAWISESSRVRYNELIDTYGHHWNPPLSRDAGVLPYVYRDNLPTWQIDREHWAKARTMNRWRKEGVKP